MILKKREEEGNEKTKKKIKLELKKEYFNNKNERIDKFIVFSFL